MAVLRVQAWIGALCALCATAAPAAAEARDEARAKALFEVAVRHHKAGRFEPAIAAYQEAYDAAPLPDFLFNIGQCYRVLGQTDRAIFFFERYRDDAPTETDRLRVERLLVKLRAERDAQRRADAAATLAAPPRPPPPVALSPPTEAPPAETPVVKTWWFWTIVGVAAAGAVTGAVIVAGGGSTNGSLGTFDYR